MPQENPLKNYDKLPEDVGSLLEVRCPYERVSKSDLKVYKCNSLCVKVSPGSSGEARCRKCGANFLFGVKEDAQVQTGVRAEPIQ